MEISPKTLMTFLSISTKRYIIKPQKIPDVKEGVEKLNSCAFFGGDVKCYSYYGKKVLFQKSLT